jgi:hypothetical protein
MLDAMVQLGRLPVSLAVALDRALNESSIANARDAERDNRLRRSVVAAYTTERRRTPPVRSA